MAACGEMRSTPVAVIAWAAFQPRSSALARDLHGEVCFVHFPRLARHRALLPIRYAVAALSTWRRLNALDPEVAMVITPPVVAPAVVAAWCRLRRRPYVVDCHTDTFDSRRWRWARPVHRWLLAHARLTLVHTEMARRVVDGWGTEAILLPDDLPDPEQAEGRVRAHRRAVLVAGSLDDTEPVGETIAAACSLPDVEVRITGDERRIPASIRDAAPGNVILTGYLRYGAFLGEMRAASVVVALSNDPQVMNRAAFEAIALGRPLVLSDHPGLRARFGAAALFTANHPDAIAATVRAALGRRRELEARSSKLRTELQQARDAAMKVLRDVLEADRPAAARQGVELPA